MANSDDLDNRHSKVCMRNDFEDLHHEEDNGDDDGVDGVDEVDEFVASAVEDRVSVVDTV